MWAGQSYGQFDPDHKHKNALDNYFLGFTWQEANDYCASLKLGGFTGWRLPSLDEAKAATVTRSTTGPYPNTFMENKAARELDNWASQIPYNALFFKGGVKTDICGSCTYQAQNIWTSTQEGDKLAWILAFNVEMDGKDGDPSGPKIKTQQSPAALCTRPMEADLLQIAKDAQVNRPVPDVQTLKGYITLNQAHLAYQAGQYQQSLTQAQEALAQNADPENAYLGIGASYGQLGQWDQAIANIQSALKINKNYNDAKTALKWAKDGQKAASKGKQTSKPSPKWN